MVTMNPASKNLKIAQRPSLSFSLSKCILRGPENSDVSSVFCFVMLFSLVWGPRFSLCELCRVWHEHVSPVMKQLHLLPPVFSSWCCGQLLDFRILTLCDYLTIFSNSSPFSPQCSHNGCVAQFY